MSQGLEVTINNIREIIIFDLSLSHCTSPDGFSVRASRPNDHANLMLCWIPRIYVLLGLMKGTFIEIGPQNESFVDHLTQSVASEIRKVEALGISEDERRRSRALNLFISLTTFVWCFEGLGWTLQETILGH